MSELPSEAERLLSTTPAEFVAERRRIAAELRAEGRSEDAASVDALRKPTAVVLAVNRASRDRPQVARDAAEAALRVRQTQVSGDQDAYRAATKELERSLDLLAEVAIAHVAAPGKPASDAMRRRTYDLLRSAVADDDARAALARGALADEQEAPGFSSFAGVALPSPSKRKATAKRSDLEPRKRRAREEKLREELRRAERALRDADRLLEQAARDRERAAKAVAAIGSKLDRL